MKAETGTILSKYENLNIFVHDNKDTIISVFNVIDQCYANGGKLLICGNGGSAADADHIVGELVKAFAKKRSLLDGQKVELEKLGDEGKYLADKLQGSLPAINLCSQSSLITAIINDIGPEMIYAQQVFSYGKAGDVLIGISTSGNSRNVILAGITAKMMGIKTVALTGQSGGKIAGIFDFSIKVPSTNTPDIQDMHSVIYHLLCLMLEAQRWDD